MLTLSPMMVAPVCRVGDPLQITCTASVEFIRWSMMRVNEQGTLEKITNDVVIDSRDDNQDRENIPLVNYAALLTFMRNSDQGATPLISTLSIDSVSIGLNETVVSCWDVVNPMVSASTNIKIMGVNQSELISILLILSVHYS